jgi:acetolactate synthase-1/2/3 large subunit
MACPSSSWWWTTACTARSACTRSGNNPDFAALARAYGGHGETVRKTEEFGPALARARNSGTAAIIHCLIDPEAITPARSLTDIRNAALNARGA